MDQRLFLRLRQNPVRNFLIFNAPRFEQFLKQSTTLDFQSAKRERTLMSCAAAVRFGLEPDLLEVTINLIWQACHLTICERPL